MNIRSLTRGDGVLIGAAVVLFIASFLGISGCDAPEAICDQVNNPNSWELSYLGWGAFFLGLAGAALVVFSRSLPQPLKVAGLDLGQVGAAFTVAAAWNLLMWIFEAENAGAGLVLRPGLGRAPGPRPGRTGRDGVPAHPRRPHQRRAALGGPRGGHHHRRR